MIPWVWVLSSSLIFFGGSRQLPASDCYKVWSQVVTTATTMTASTTDGDDVGGVGGEFNDDFCFPSNARLQKKRQFSTQKILPGSAFFWPVCASMSQLVGNCVNKIFPTRFFRIFPRIGTILPERALAQAAAAVASAKPLTTWRCAQARALLRSHH